MTAPAQQLLLVIRALGLPEPEGEVRFSPRRRFRADFAWPDRKLAIEIEGGVYTRQAHGSIGGVLRDIEKHNEYTLCGWRYLRFTPQDLADGTALAVLQEAWGLGVGGRERRA